MTADGLTQFRRDQRLFAYAQYQHCDLFSGKIVGIGSPAIEGHSEHNTPYGSTTGMVYQSMPRLVRSKYVLPPEIFDLGDYDLKYYVIALLSLREPDVSGLVTSNPSTLLKVLETIWSNQDRLIDDIATARVRSADPATVLGHGVPTDRFNARAVRADELSKRAGDGRQLTFGDLWPNLAGVATWTGGSCGIAVDRLRSFLPPRARVLELGYAASEFRGTIPVGGTDDRSVPTLHRNYFEFVARRDWENGVHNFLDL